MTSSVSHSHHLIIPIILRYAVQKGRLRGRLLMLLSNSLQVLETQALIYKLSLCMLVSGSSLSPSGNLMCQHWHAHLDRPGASNAVTLGEGAEVERVEGCWPDLLPSVSFRSGWVLRGGDSVCKLRHWASEAISAF